MIKKYIGRILWWRFRHKQKKTFNDIIKLYSNVLGNNILEQLEPEKLFLIKNDDSEYEILIRRKAEGD